MKMIVGLGNPGDEYESTRHNIGFMVLDKLVHELGATNASWKNETKHKALSVKVGDVLFVKPQTFMNSSGFAVAGLSSFYKIDVPDIWVVHDDIDLPIGKIRIREKGGSAGHNGLNSIIASLKGDSFVRFRLGTGRGKEIQGVKSDKSEHHQSVIDFVLSRFTQSEAGSLKHLIKHGTEAVRIALDEGIEKAMNRFN